MWTIQTIIDEEMFLYKQGVNLHSILTTWGWVVDHPLYWNTFPELTSHLKMLGWKTSFLLGWLPGRCYVSFRERFCSSRIADSYSVIDLLPCPNWWQRFFREGCLLLHSGACWVLFPWRIHGTGNIYLHGWLIFMVTLPKTNIAPTNGWLEYGILLSYWGGLFSGATLVSGRVV